MKSVLASVLFCLVVTPFLVWSQKLTESSFRPTNSGFDEQNPILGSDGVLYFTIANHPQNIGGKKDPGDIWYSSWSDGQWSAPSHGGNNLNDKGYNAVAGFSSDGNQIFLVNHYYKNGQPSTQGISWSKKIGSAWTFPENIAIPYFLNRSTLLSGQLIEDSGIFVYAAESYDTKGAEDIYVSRRDNAGKWNEPRNLGPIINTTLQELSPSLSSDQKFLYFSSNGRRGYGSFDVYFSERLDDSWQNWSIPANMGSRVNSDGRELFYRTYPQRSLALYTSTQNSDGYGDIKFYLDSLQMNIPDTVIKLVEIKRETAVGRVSFTRMKGNVTSSKTGQPIAAKLDFKADSVYGTSSNSRGSYTIAIPSTKIYTIVVEAPGYIGVLEKLDIHTFEMEQVELNFKLQPIEIGATVNLKNVLFQVGTTNLVSDSYNELDVVVDLLKSNPKVEIELAGHTDNRGDAKMNLKLSQSRVDKVKSYLVSKGISGRRIKGKGYGGQKPIAGSDSEESRKLNRRVEFTIVKD